MAQTYESAEVSENMAKRLIPSYHPELATAKIGYLMSEKAGVKNGKPVLGKVRKVSGEFQHYTGLDFVIIVAGDKWRELADEHRMALMDHLLERCFGEEDEDNGGAMKWSVRDPDVQEFTTILHRHGAWNEDIAGFIRAGRTIPVDDLMQTETGVAAAEEALTTN